MKNALVAVALAFVVSALPAYSQAPKPPDSPSKVLLDAWNEIGRKLTTMAEDFPEDKYDFKPNPAQRSFAEQLLHAASANYFFINPILGRKVPTGDPKRDQFKSKAEVAAFVKKSFGDGAELIKAKGRRGHERIGPGSVLSQSTSTHLRPGVGLPRAFWRTLRSVGRLLPGCRPGASGVPSKEIGPAR